jgi:ribose transport system ATP-binding protein
MLLQVTNVSKDFASRVLNDVSIDFEAGEIHALLGANGAGKSTLCKIIAGLQPASEGHMKVDGSTFSPSNKQFAEAAGIQIVQQELNLIPTLDVAHNLGLSKLPSRLGWIDRSELYANARRVLDQFGLNSIDPREIVGKLGVGQQQMIEIASNLSRHCKLIILDEPTAALSIRETELLFSKLTEARSTGTCIIYISHRLDEIMAIADRATILKDGSKVGTYAINELSPNKMVQLMTHGEAKSSETQPSSKSTRETSLQPTRVSLMVREVCAGPLVKNVSFSAHQGEILGIAGLVGSGRSELLRAIFGADRNASGYMSINSQTERSLFRSPAEAVRNGLVMIGEDRKRDGLMLSQSIRDNIVLAQLSRASVHSKVRNRVGYFVAKAAATAASVYRDRLQIRSQDEGQLVQTLSGGNQQKVILARWMLRGADILFLDEPTRGIDVAARELIYGVLHELCDQGKSIVLVSSDLEELISLSDRIGVLSNGRWIGEVAGPTYSRTKINEMMFEGYG